jgi:hypothetical protein
VSEPTGSYTVYRYVGPGYLNGCPARDLLPADLVELARREGIVLEEIEASGLYVAEEQIEITPFCGAPAEGARCQEAVDAWGDRCPEHVGMGPGDKEQIE